MILPDTKRVVIVNAGHWDDPLTAPIEDTGATRGLLIEQVECVKIRNELVPFLEHEGFTVHAVPDHLDLRESIAWANERAPNLNDALAIDIHLNANNNSEVRGAEGYHGVSDISRNIASAVTKHVAKEMVIPNRGAKPDTATHVGELGWIRKTTMWATLIEVCYLTNGKDMDILRAPGGYRKAARGIRNGIMEVFGMELPQQVPISKQENEHLAELLHDTEEHLRQGLEAVQSARRALQS